MNHFIKQTVLQFVFYGALFTVGGLTGSHGFQLGQALFFASLFTVVTTGNFLVTRKKLARKRAAELTERKVPAPSVPQLKDEALPVCTTVAVTAGGGGRSWEVIGEPTEVDVAVARLAAAAHDKAIAAATIKLEDDDRFFEADPVKVTHPGPSPETQAELSADLLAFLKEQWQAAEPTRRRHGYPYPGHWEMNEEWAAEVRKLKKQDGTPLWKPESYLLMGYNFMFGDEYGAPDLVTPPLP